MITLAPKPWDGAKDESKQRNTQHIVSHYNDKKYIPKSCKISHETHTSNHITKVWGSCVSGWSAKKSATEGDWTYACCRKINSTLTSHSIADCA